MRLTTALVAGALVLASVLSGCTSIHNSILRATFTPTKAMTAVIDRVGFTEAGKKLLYEGHPKLLKDAAFTKACESGEQGGTYVTLGCFANGKIYVLDVEAKQLDGTMEVSLAHEFLHLVWSRASTKEQATLEKGIDGVDCHVVGDGLCGRLKYYRMTEPGEQDNELHSILGSEVSTVPASLARHYAAYFSDRADVVAEYTASRTVFDRYDALLKRLNKKNKALDKKQTHYSKVLDAYNDDVDSFNANVDSYTSQGAYDADRNALLARADHLQVLRKKLKAGIRHYNKTVKRAHRQHSKLEQLNAYLDSTIPDSVTLGGQG
jgi:hypothetical protein